MTGDCAVVCGLEGGFEIVVKADEENGGYELQVQLLCSQSKDLVFWWGCGDGSLFDVQGF